MSNHHPAPASHPAHGNDDRVSPYRGNGGFKGVCFCGYACREKPSMEAARAAVEAHAAKAAK